MTAERISFETADGTVWYPRCRLSTIARVKEDLELDLIPANDKGNDVDVNQAEKRLSDNPLLLLDVMAIYCEQDIVEKGMTVEAAKDAFDQGPLRPMVEAFSAATRRFVDGGAKTARPTGAKARKTGSRGK